ncbi:hypothetical protein [Frankia sp. EI5c]
MNTELQAVTTQKDTTEEQWLALAARIEGS